LPISGRNPPPSVRHNVIAAAFDALLEIALKFA
jgi:hypothetical protein